MTQVPLYTQVILEVAQKLIYNSQISARHNVGGNSKNKIAISINLVAKDMLFLEVTLTQVPLCI